MVNTRKIRAGVLGASGYTGADLVRLMVRHPRVEIVALVGNTHAGKTMDEVFPHLAGMNLPGIASVEGTDWTDIDVLFCGLPHGVVQDLLPGIFRSSPNLRVIDMSADFRLRDPYVYESWYGRKHGALELQENAVYGLTEHYRGAVGSARLVACPGCYPTATLMGLIPLLESRLVDPGDIVIDAKSGVSGAGRSPREGLLFSECGEGMSAYCVGKHRHAPEIEQELGYACKQDIVVSFTPHLIPMSRGELVTAYLRFAKGVSLQDAHECLMSRYRTEAFVRVLPEGHIPGTQHVRGSNFLILGAVQDRVPGRMILFSALDNLVKGSSGQALQNMNVMFGLEETLGLEQCALFP